MQKNKKVFTIIGIVISNIILAVSFILALFLKKDYGYSLFWVVSPFLMLLLLSLVIKWSAVGLNVDNEKSKEIQRAFNDTTTISIFFFAIIYLSIQIVEFWNEDIRKNPFVIIIFFAVMIIYELTTYLEISNAKKDTAKLLDKTYNKK